MSEKKIYKLNISGGAKGPGKGLSKLVEIDEKKFRFEGMVLGSIIKGGLIGFPNYEFEITGGSDSHNRKGRYGDIGDEDVPYDCLVELKKRWQENNKL